ncbi:MAG: rRNA maturation RNase YbeY [Bdellovibrionales bacterium]|nr:rRNA maturation RNase YbeY [Bdellovibrionales bacterium]
MKKRKIGDWGELKEVVIVFLSSEEAQRLNREFRHKDYATDVLSFSSGDPSCLGEIVISLDKIRQQAKQHRMGVKEELSYLVLHGLLHLLGFDHERSEAEAKSMFRLQDSIWEKFWKSRLRQ